jgi:branched-subunit amino acid transport protein
MTPIPLAAYPVGLVWAIILGGMLVTYAARLSFIALFPPDSMPPGFRRALHFVLPAVLSAIVLPELVRPGGVIQLGLANDRLVAGALAVLAAWRLRNTWATLGVGLVAYALLLEI